MLDNLENFDGKQKLIFIIAVGVLLSCMFLLGSWYSCHSGDGQLTGLTCMGYKEIGICEFEGKKYKVPELDYNFTEGLFNGS